MKAPFHVHGVTGAIDIEAAIDGRIAARLGSATFRIEAAAVDRLLARHASAQHAKVRSIEEGKIILEGRVGPLKVVAALVLTVTRAGRIDVQLDEIGVAGLPVGRITSLREELASQLRDRLPVLAGLAPGKDDHIATIDVQALARTHGVELSKLSSLRVEDDAIEMAFG